MARHPSKLAVVCLLATALGFLTVGKAPAQVSDGIPDRRYFLGVEELYSGELRDAGRIFRREANRGVRVGNTRWVDSICYHAMLGEVHYQMGNNADAMAQYDQACQLFLQYPSWLSRVEFRNPIRPDTNRMRQQGPPWGRSNRQFILGQFNETMMVLHGRQPNVEEIKRQQVTVVETPQFFRLRVPEIVRCTALAIRRRNEILGPLAKYDRISKDLTDTLSRGGLTRPNSWSRVWVELWLGLAHIGSGNLQQAQTHLSRGLLVEGRYDHPLTCVVLLEQGRLAMEAGNAPLAARLLAEASFSAYWFENWNVIEESLRLAADNHIAINAPLVFPPLDLAAEWSRRRGLRMLTASLRISQAENQAVLNQTSEANQTLDESTRWLGEFSAGRLGIRHLYVQALLGYQQNQRSTGDKVLRQALQRQRAASFREFQIQLTSRLYDGSGGTRITARAASEVYALLLRDPTAEDWLRRPLDSLALLGIPHRPAFDRWFTAAMERKDILEALLVAERTKRRKFNSALAWGGRLLALRNLLESPADKLPNQAALDRQQISTSFPSYQGLSQASAMIRSELRKGPILPQLAKHPAHVDELYDKWADNSGQRESMLRQMGLRRVPAPLSFPPLLTTEELQAALQPGQVIVLFHTVGPQLHGFLLTKENYHTWRLGSGGQLKKTIADLLREIGNYGPGRNLAAEDLKDDTWRHLSHELFRQIFADSRLALGATEELIIVPDHLLWYLPFDMLRPVDGEEYTQLIDQALIRQAPTAGLAMSKGHPLRRIRTTALVATQVATDLEEEFFAEQFDRLASTVSGPVTLPTPLPVPAPMLAPLVDQLISFDDISGSETDPLGWSPFPKDRGRGSSSLSNLLALPRGGPERVVLAGFSTAAENGLKGTYRRSDKATFAPGDELFFSTAAMMAAGSRTMLLSRWRTGGQTNLGLVQEFVQELPHMTAAEAWQRSVLLARDTPLDLNREPRLKLSEEHGELPNSDHPFLWAGYLLVDNSEVLDQNGEQTPAEQPVVKFKNAVQ